jgi:ribonucleoside-triphosphate reductase (thioredoxin)
MKEEVQPVTDQAVPFGPTGEAIYQRTYSRVKPNGERETWPYTVNRVVKGNLELVYGPHATWSEEVRAECNELIEYMLTFKILPAGRHLWASGVKGRQYLFNCHVAGWEAKLSKHFEFTFLRLMEGGGVGANYSSKYLAPFGAPRRELTVHIVCDPSHPDYQEMLDGGVLSDVYDSDWDGAFEVEDSREGWAAALVDLIDTYMTDDEVLHENRVYDVSRVRGKGSRLKTFGGTASGPQPFGVMMHEASRVMNDAHEASMCGGLPQLTPVAAMEIDHAIAECVVSGGNRRSARMAICHWRDPFIHEFLRCKADGSRHWTTNISVEIDDEFIEHLGDPMTNASLVHRKVVEGMLTNGEPGYWNSSLSNKGEVNPVIATNPCGEIALEAWENCNLGHVNLDAFAPTEKGGTIDYHGLSRAHRLMTRFLIRATFGDVNDEGQAAKLARNRRIGVGHFGVQGFFAKQGIRYSMATELRRPTDDLSWMKGVVRKTARDYAFELRIPEPVKVTTVAPTGTIAKLPGVTEGIHPIYARFFERRVRFSLADPDQYETVQESWRQGFGVETDVYDKSGNTAVVVYPTKDKLVEEVEALGYPAEYVEAADEISVDQMLAFQAMYQTAYADNAVSFTVNVPEGLDVETTAATIARWLPQLKGTTVMVDGSREQAPYTRITEAEYEAAAAKLVADGTDEDCASGACPVR